MGRIVGAFGIKGWIRVKTESNLEKYPELMLNVNGTWIVRKVEKITIHDLVTDIKLSGIDDRDQAISLKGVEIGIKRDKFPDLPSDEYYQTDLIGLSVINKSQENLGIVKNLMETGANTVLIVNDEKTERLIPFVKSYIISVDLEKKQIVADWGLDY